MIGSYEFIAHFCFGTYLCRMVSVDYTVDQHDDVELLSVWTMVTDGPIVQHENGRWNIGEEITDYLTAEGKDYFQQLCEQDWRDRKQDEAEAYEDRHAYIND